MSAESLLMDLVRLGIKLEAHGDRLRYHPQGAMTPDLIDRLRTHKAELLAALRSAVDPDGVATAPVTGEPAESGPEAAPEAIRWEDAIHPPDPCSKCGSLELWQTLAGNWRCMRCDPPTTAQRLAELAGRIRRKMGRTKDAGHKSQ
ncbi:MAG: hypothetical protein HQ581_16935 [Planctomycetes bacterium]|nr:hypothetical protein [Planctomycetota bacterium]